MDRKEKRKIRRQISRLLDAKCKGCGFKKSQEHEKYCSKTCPVGIHMQELMAQLCSDEVSITKAEPGEMPQSLKRGSWSDDEILYLVNHVSHFTVNHLAERLNRNPQSVYLKIRYLGVKKHAI